MFMTCKFNSDLFEQEVGEGSCPWARPCDACCAAPSAVCCRADTTYCCASCDARVHAPNRVAWRADAAAALCAAGDAQVPSANPFAGRHQRVPVLPLPAAAIPAASGLAEAAATTAVLGDKEDEMDAWLLLNKDYDNNNCNNNMYFGEVDEYLDLVGYNSYYGNKNQEEQYGVQEPPMQRYGEKEGSECVVPSQVAMASELQQQSGYGIVGVEQDASMTAGLSAYTASISNRISFSSTEVALVPDNTMTDISNSASDAFSGPSLQTPLQLSSMDREARVLRYREKKKTRKFVKTIRYATRKAYAEARPRIKGRFAKRSDVELEVDQMFSSAALSDSSYATVPWF